MTIQVEQCIIFGFGEVYWYYGGLQKSIKLFIVNSMFLLQ